MNRNTIKGCVAWLAFCTIAISGACAYDVADNHRLGEVSQASEGGCEGPCNSCGEDGDCEGGQICTSGGDPRCQCPWALGNITVWSEDDESCIAADTDQTCGLIGNDCKTSIGQTCVVDPNSLAVECSTGCTGSQWYCGSTCVASNTTTNCGSCGNACASGQSCIAGTCECPSGQILCGGSCVADNTVTNCGSCGNACVTGQSCNSGVCECPSGQIPCGGSCVDDDTTTNCGSCGNACTNTGETCNSGVCECPLGESVCGSVCVALDTDPNDCGSCGNDCTSDPASDGTCSSGACQCGAGLACAGGDVCVSGSCETSCANNYDCDPGELCSKASLSGSGYCELVTTGASAEASCTAGSDNSLDRPCFSGFRSNGTHCVDTCTDPTNCGASDVNCSQVTPYCCIVSLQGGTGLGFAQCEDDPNPSTGTCDFAGENRSN